MKRLARAHRPNTFDSATGLRQTFGERAGRLRPPWSHALRALAAALVVGLSALADGGTTRGAASMALSDTHSMAHAASPRRAQDVLAAGRASIYLPITMRAHALSEALRVSLDAGRLDVVGSPGKDDVVLRMDPSGKTVEVDDRTNGVGTDHRFELALVQTFNVELGAGDDWVIFDDTNGSLGTLRPLKIDVGDGHNVALGSTGSLTPSEIAALPDVLPGVITKLRALDQSADALTSRAEQLERSASAYAATEGVTLTLAAERFEADAQARLFAPGVALSDSLASDGLETMDRFGRESDALLRASRAVTDRLDTFRVRDSEVFSQTLRVLTDEAEAKGEDEEAVEDVTQRIDALSDAFASAAEEQGQRAEIELTSPVAALDALALEIEKQDDDTVRRAGELEAVANEFAERFDSDFAGDRLDAEADRIEREADDINREADRLAEEVEAVLAEVGGLFDPPSGRIRDGHPMTLSEAASPQSTPPPPTAGCSPATNLIISGSGGGWSSGTAANDYMIGSVNVDVMFGYLGDDEMHGDDDNDWIFGNADDDCIFGEAGGDRLFGDLLLQFFGGGSPGKDRIDGGDDIDFMRGDAEADTMNGNGATDVIFGNADGDTIHGNDGGDVILGNTGADTIRGDAGGDVVFGNADLDTLYGDIGSDWLFGNADIDLMFGGDGGDFMWGGDEVGAGDTMRGNDGFDVMSGGDGMESMEGNDGSDFMRGGNDNDNLVGNDGADFMSGGAGADGMAGLAGFDFMSGDADADTMSGGANGDLMWGRAGADDMQGDFNGNGNDFMFGNDGPDTMGGGAGTDFMWGNAAADTMNGDAGNDFMFGNEGDDTMYGGDGTDLLWGGDGCDHMHGGNGVDFMWGGAGVDTMWGDAGTDFMWGGTGDDTMYGGTGNDFMWGGTGNDAMWGDAGNDFMWGGDGDDCMTGGAGNDFMWGNIGNDILHGEGGADFLWGNDGDDHLYGGAGSDVLWGGQGNDELCGNDGNDFLSGGDGADTLHGDAGSDLMFGNDGDDAMYGGAGNDYMVGNAGDDALCGNDGNDWMWGNTGIDTLDGGTGNDRMWGNQHNDTLFGDVGNDWMWGNDDDDNMDGGPGNDRIWGGAGADTMYGGAGNDWMFGGPGNDWMCGGSGNDIVWGGGGNNTINPPGCPDVSPFPRPNCSSACNPRLCERTVCKDAVACDLAIVKAIKPDPPVSGQQATFILTVTNFGTAPCAGPVTLTDVLPAGFAVVGVQAGTWACSETATTVACTWPGPVPPGALPPVLITGNVTTPLGATLHNCASVNSPNDSNPSNNVSCIDVPVMGGPNPTTSTPTSTSTPTPTATSTATPTHTPMVVVGCATPPAGMVAWWPLDEVAGDTSVVDIVGGFDGTPRYGGPPGNSTDIQPGPFPVLPNRGPAEVLGSHVANSLQSGIWRYVGVPDDPSLDFGTGAFSIDAWIRYTPGTQTEPIVYKMDPAAAGGNGYHLFLGSSTTSGNADRLELQIGPTTFIGPLITAAHGSWIFVAATRNGDVVNLYVGQGTNWSSTSGAGALTLNASSAADLLIGGWPGNPHAALAIDEVEIFNRAVTTQECAAIFNAGSAGKCRTIKACDLAITKTAHPGSPLASGQQAWFGLSVDNVGTGMCAGPIKMTDVIPAGFTYAGVVWPGGSLWTCSAGGTPPLLTCSGSGPVPPGPLGLISMMGQVGGPAGFVIHNCAKVSSPDDGNAANDESCIDVPIAPSIHPVPTPGCVPRPASMAAWWALDERSGTTVRDSVGDNHGVAEGGASVLNAAKVAAGRSFDAGMVVVPDAPSLDAGRGDFSIAVWVNPSTDAPLQPIVTKLYAPADAPLGYAFTLERLVPTFTMSNEGGSLRVTDHLTMPVRLGHWTLLAVTVQRGSPTGGKLYRNGMLYHTFDTTGLVGGVDTPADLHIGEEPRLGRGGAQHFFSGGIDEVQIFHRSLTAAESLSIYTAGSFGTCDKPPAPTLTPTPRPRPTSPSDPLSRQGGDTQ